MLFLPISNHRAALPASLLHPLLRVRSNPFLALSHLSAENVVELDLSESEPHETDVSGTTGHVENVAEEEPSSKVPRSSKETEIPKKKTKKNPPKKDDAKKKLKSDESHDEEFDDAYGDLPDEVEDDYEFDDDDVDEDDFEPDVDVCSKRLACKI